jgi:PAS domain-containing protein
MIRRGEVMKRKVKTNQQLLLEIEELRKRLDATERRLQEADESLQAQIAERKRAEETFERVQKYAESSVETIREPLIVLTPDLRVITANHSFYGTFQATREETEGRFVYSLGDHAWNIPSLRELLEEIIPQNSYFNDFEVDHAFPVIGRRTMRLNARRIYREGKGTDRIPLALEDITERKLIAEALQQAHDELERRAEERTVELRTALSEIKTMKDQLEAENIYFRQEIKGKQITSIPKETMKALQDYPWPGNVRELESVIERAVILCPGPVLQLADKLEISSLPLSSAVRTLEEMERNQILKTLSETRWRIEGKDGAAAILGLNPSTLRARMHKLGIVRPEIKEPD